MLKNLFEERGECTLEYLRQMTDAEIKSELSRCFAKTLLSSGEAANTSVCCESMSLVSGRLQDKHTLSMNSGICPSANVQALLNADSRALAARQLHASSCSAWAPMNHSQWTPTSGALQRGLHGCQMLHQGTRPTSTSTAACQMS